MIRLDKSKAFGDVHGRTQETIHKRDLSLLLFPKTVQGSAVLGVLGYLPSLALRQ